MRLKLSALIQRFLAYAEAVNSPGTVLYYRRHLSAFLEHVGNRQASELRRIDAAAWATTWHRVQSIQRLFSWAVNEAELLDRNPFSRLKKPHVEGRMRVLSHKEIIRLLRGSSKDYRAYLIALRETLARPQEIRSLTWEMFHIENHRMSREESLVAGHGCFVLTEYKARGRRRDPGKPRVILVNRRLGRLLLRLLRDKPDASGHVFQTARKRPWTPNTLRLRMRRLRERTKLGPDHRGEPIVAYSFRHTGATRAAAIGIRDRLLSELMGHGNPRTTARYQHLEIEDLREAMQKLESDRGRRKTRPA